MSNRILPKFEMPRGLKRGEIMANGDISVADLIFKIDEVHSKFKGFIARNDAELAAITVELARQNGRATAASIAPGNVASFSGIDREHRGEFVAYARSGTIRAAMSTDSNPDGGYVVPEFIDNQLQRLALNTSPLRRVCNVVTSTSGTYSKIVNLLGSTASWVGEKDARPQTEGIKLGKISIVANELCAMPATTQQLLDDASIDVAGELSLDIARAFSEVETTAFVNGSGVNQPFGFLNSSILVANAQQAWGKIGFLKSGVNGGFVTPTASASPADILLDLIYSLKSEYRANAVWLMNSSTAGALRKVKDLEGRFIWQEALAAGQPATLLGYPVEIEEQMPSIANGAFPIAFGDYKRAYTIVDRRGTVLLRDPFSLKPYVLFYTTKRVGGGITDFHAMKVLQTSA